MNHQVGGVGFDHIGGGRGADDVGLVGLVFGKRVDREESGTRSAPEKVVSRMQEAWRHGGMRAWMHGGVEVPKRADAMAEK